MHVEPGKIVVDEAVEFLKSRFDEQPFFMWIRSICVRSVLCLQPRLQIGLDEFVVGQVRVGSDDLVDLLRLAL